MSSSDHPQDHPSFEVISGGMDSSLEDATNHTDSSLDHTSDQSLTNDGETGSIDTLLASHFDPMSNLGHNQSMELPIRSVQIEASMQRYIEAVQSEPAGTASQSSAAQSAQLSPQPDTLVYIFHPKRADFAKYEYINRPIRAHSKNLLATGSKVFRDLLSPTKQFRTLRRLKLANNLPEGIKYAIDLTPPEEGDQAVDLIANLSLSAGVSRWYLMKHIGVCGSDESADSDLIPLIGMKSSKRFEKTSLQEYLTAQDNSTSRPILDPRFSSTKNSDLASAMGLSQTRQIPEYSDVRHRLGIQRLIQIIEGKTPNLDSAPKVWTLWVLAQYFECTPSVLDCVSLWLLAHPNTLFVEILPEMSAKIGFGIESHAVTRAAFCVLVGEEALLMRCRRRDGVQPEELKFTKFGRHREDIDEDLQNRIEYASKAFDERIAKTFDDFYNASLAWLENLPEYQKLARFHGNICSAEEDEPLQWTKNIEVLRSRINCMIRRRIIYALDSSIVHTPNGIGAAFIKHRDRHSVSLALPTLKTTDTTLRMYNELGMQERVFTVPFWKILSEHGFKSQDLMWTDRLAGSGAALAREEKIEDVTYDELLDATRNFNLAVAEAISTGCLDVDSSAALQRETDKFQLWEAPPNAGPFDEDGFYNPPGIQLPDKNSTIPTKDTLSSESLPTGPAPSPSSTKISKINTGVPDSKNITGTSSFLNMDTLLFQIDGYASHLCNTMLSTETMGFDLENTDVLVCLTDNEFKYLPIFAGGEDDGTGLVFTDPVPEAANGLTPIGPGPRFRTEHSVANSEDSESSYGYRNGEENDGGSNMVEDGFSGVFPRTRVGLGSDLASLAMSDAGITEAGVGDWNGILEGNAREMGPTFTPASSVVGAVSKEEDIEPEDLNMDFMNDITETTASTALADGFTNMGGSEDDIYDLSDPGADEDDDMDDDDDKDTTIGEEDFDAGDIDVSEVDMIGEGDKCDGDGDTKQLEPSFGIDGEDLIAL